MPAFALEIDQFGTIRDEQDRYIILRGINLDGGAKMPIGSPSTFDPVDDAFWDGDNVSFSGRPFSLNDAPVHLRRLKAFGFNTIRYLFTWEALEHSGPGKYDDEFIDYTIEVLKLLDKYGFYVFMDPHQDVWSRYSGGSGAPLWTLYAMGLNPKAFKVTDAALVQNTYDEPDKYPKMIWATNYSRLACQVAFTLFTAGLHFAPKAIINGQNIQEFLQEHMLKALMYFYKRIFTETDLANRTIIGVETFNELNHGLVGISDITVLSEESKLKLGTTPTAFQAMLLGSGIAQEIDVYEFRALGPAKVGTQVIDPKGVKAWLPADYDDSRYGWKRDPGWELGRCIWAQHGVWDDETNEIINSEYFKYTQEGEILTPELFNNTYFMQYWSRFYMAMREVDKKMFLLCQPPVLTIPPNLKDSAFMDSNVIYAPHYYDGLTLVNKHWNRWWNVDVLGILRGRYSSPAFAIKVGETSIRNCLKEQLAAIRQEGLEHFGNTPCLMSETGMPFDLDDRAAYQNGDYSSQIASWDALGFALEGSQIHHTLWTYCAKNSHHAGDYWNGEDFSVFCSGQEYKMQPHPLYRLSYTQAGFNSSSEDVSDSYSSSEREMLNWKLTHGNRAERAIARPFPLAIAGELKEYKFDMKQAIFTLTIDGVNIKEGTLISLPNYSFPDDQFEIEVSAKEGIDTKTSWEFNQSSRILTWYNSKGPQTITIRSTSVPEATTSAFYAMFDFLC